eukprot:6323835-Pyramimonas_sp.AAC.1
MCEGAGCDSGAISHKTWKGGSIDHENHLGNPERSAATRGLEGGQQRDEVREACPSPTQRVAILSGTK